MSRLRPYLQAIAVAFALFLGIATAAGAATIVIVNNDGPGEGFNDPTPDPPFGGNPGTTLGEKRLFIFNYAASIWGGILPSDVTIRVLAQFNSQTCDATSGVLGSAGARSAHANFPGAPFANMYYHQALANRLSGTDLSPTLEDINATFNSDVDNAVCLGDISWYYGTDGQDGADIELLPVVLHELGHGLGFSTFASSSTGAFLDGTPDIFAHFLLNTSTGLHWDQMTNNNARKSSAVNTGNLVWDGSSVNLWAPYVLQHEPELLVLSPATIDGSYVANLAGFGGSIDATGITSGIVLVTDTVAPVNDGCESFVNGPALAGKFALIDRGLCTFVAKVAAAQASGAIGVIVANNVAGAPTTMGGTDPSITIPSIMISQADGTTIKNALLSGPVTATIRRHPTQLAGANSGGKVKMYAPNPVEPGSSVSHFDVSAFPDLLMEPGINSGLHDGVDLTRRLFEDIGWMPAITGVEPVVTAPKFRVRSAPNPFTPATTILLALPTAGRTRVAVYDVQGRLVKRLLDSWMPAGTHGIAWDGSDEHGRRAAAGVYFSRVESNGRRAGERLVKLER